MKRLFAVLALVAALVTGTMQVAAAAPLPKGPSPLYVDCSVTEEVTVQDSGTSLWFDGNTNFTTRTQLRELRDANTQHYCGHMQVWLQYSQSSDNCETFDINLRAYPSNSGLTGTTTGQVCGLTGGILTKSYPIGTGGCYYAHSWVVPFPSAEVSTPPSCV